MRFLVQRVSRASVTVEGRVEGSIGAGLVVLIGISKTDGKEEADALTRKLVELRIFSDAAGQMNLSSMEVKAELLLVSQFTLYGDCTRGRRPSFDRAARADEARLLYEYVVEQVRASGLRTATGVFQAHMDVELVNDGPVTLLLEN